MKNGIYIVGLAAILILSISVGIKAANELVLKKEMGRYERTVKTMEKVVSDYREHRTHPGSVRDAWGRDLEFSIGVHTLHLVSHGSDVADGRDDIRIDADLEKGSLNISYEYKGHFHSSDVFED